MADFADALEEETSKKTLFKGEKSSKDSGKKGVTASRVAGFFHPSNTHLHSFKREIDFLDDVLEQLGVKFSFHVFEESHPAPTSR